MTVPADFVMTGMALGIMFCRRDFMPASDELSTGDVKFSPLLVSGCLTYGGVT